MHFAECGLWGLVNLGLTWIVFMLALDYCIIVMKCILDGSHWNWRNQKKSNYLMSTWTGKYSQVRPFYFWGDCDRDYQFCTADFCIFYICLFGGKMSLITFCEFVGLFSNKTFPHSLPLPPIPYSNNKVLLERFSCKRSEFAK